MHDQVHKNKQIVLILINTNSSLKAGSEAQVGLLHAVLRWLLFLPLDIPWPACLTLFGSCRSKVNVYSAQAEVILEPLQMPLVWLPSS